MTRHTRAPTNTTNSGECAEIPQATSLFDDPSEVESWNHSIFRGPVWPGDYSLPSPPDTNSYCDSPDSATISQAWTYTPQPEDWCTAAFAAPSTELPTFGSDTLDTSPMESTPIAFALDFPVPGPVDQGLSSAVNHESHGAKTFDPNAFAMASSFTMEPPFNSPEQVASTDGCPGVDGDHFPHWLFPYACYPGHPSGDLAEIPYGPYQEGYQTSTDLPSGTGTGLVRDPAGKGPLPRKRPLLPRAEDPRASKQGSRPSDRDLKPHMTVSHHSIGPDSNVSGAAGQLRSCSALTARNGYHGPVVWSDPNSILPWGLAGQNFAPFSQSGPAEDPYEEMVSAEEFNAFVHYEQSDRAISSTPMGTNPSLMQPPQLGVSNLHSDAPAPGEPAPVGSHLPDNRMACQGAPDQDANTLAIGTGNIPGTAHENHENSQVRIRSHPLYNTVPRADGLYHCPFKEQVGCAHEPQKLKCAFHKYLDAHLKPWKCQQAPCKDGGQRFSSSACRLRHEREAHGMHGHGDRPHLCIYTPCDRSEDGNGFPRRFNLHDHMKRVHGHTDPKAGTRRNGSAARRERKGADGWKRKNAPKPPAVLDRQRQKSQLVSSRQSRSQANQSRESTDWNGQQMFQQPLGFSSQEDMSQRHEESFLHAGPHMGFPDHRVGLFQNPGTGVSQAHSVRKVEQAGLSASGVKGSRSRRQ